MSLLRRILGPKREPRWMLAIVAARGLDADWGFAFCEALVARWSVRSIYFAAYDSKGAAPRVEIKFKAPATVPQLRDWIRHHEAVPAEAKVTVRSRGPWSEAHSRAYEVVREIRRAKPKQFGQLYDVVHWMTNMLGLTYIEEATYLGSGALRVLQGVYENAMGESYRHPLAPPEPKAGPTGADPARTARPGRPAGASRRSS
jgi:hypothetical protein